jgi:hypothetical chaperone protein
MDSAEGTEHYLSKEASGRLIQSLKSFLTSRTLQSTEIFGRRLTVEDLIARILRDLREEAERQFEVLIASAIAGRPVRFVGTESEEDDLYAEGRLPAALQLAGFEPVEFVPEPVAAAHYYESTLERDERILIGDFGGGTSDFSLIRVGPTIRRRGRTREDILGNAGIWIAGMPSTRRSSGIWFPRIWAQERRYARLPGFSRFLVGYTRSLNGGIVCRY